MSVRQLVRTVPGLLAIHRASIEHSTGLYRRLSSMASERALAAGSPYPRLSQDTWRLYSMRFCPFAQRTRLVLAHKHIPHEVVNVNLKFKPDWFLARNPVGLVPVLEYNDRVVYESSVCDEYLDDVFPEDTLLPRDPFQRAQQKMLMEIFTKVPEMFGRLYRPRYTEDQRQRARDKLTYTFLIFERHLRRPFFGGDQPSMVDFHIWPWFERLEPIQRMSGHTVLSADRFPRLTQWMAAMTLLPAVQETRMSAEMHGHFVTSLMQGAPDYDHGLPTANL